MSDHTERQHSELAASATARWWNCPGSVALSRGIPPEPPTIHAQRGTAAHEVAEMCLRSGQDAIEYVGRTVNGIEFDAELADGVQVYLDDCRSLIPNTILPSAMQVEVQFDLATLNPPVPMFGTADFVAYVPVWRKLYVKDYKNGFLHVPADMPQLRYYALGAVLALGPSKPVGEVEVTIVQPNGTGEPVRRATFDAVELTEWSLELIERAEATQRPDAPRVVGAWCRWCPARGVCPTRAAEALAVAQIEFADAVLPADTALCSVCREPQQATPSGTSCCNGHGGADEARLAVVPPPVAILTPEQVGALLRRVEAVEAWIDDLRKGALAELKAGRAVPGWKLVNNRPSSVWLDRDDAVLALEAVHDIDPWQPLSPAQAREALRDKLHAAALAVHTGGKKPTKKAAEEAARALLAPLIRTASTGVVLAPDSDPRPAVLAGGSEFDALPAPAEES